MDTWGIFSEFTCVKLNQGKKFLLFACGLVFRPRAQAKIRPSDFVEYRVVSQTWNLPLSISHPPDMNAREVVTDLLKT